MIPEMWGRTAVVEGGRECPGLHALQRKTACEAGYVRSTVVGGREGDEPSSRDPAVMFAFRIPSDASTVNSSEVLGQGRSQSWFLAFSERKGEKRLILCGLCISFIQKGEFKTWQQNGFMITPCWTHSSLLLWRESQYACSVEHPSANHRLNSELGYHSWK